MKSLQLIKLIMLLGTLTMASQSFARGGGNCRLSDGSGGVLAVVQPMITECSSPTSCVVIQPEILRCVARPRGN